MNGIGARRGMDEYPTRVRTRLRQIVCDAVTASYRRRYWENEPKKCEPWIALRPRLPVLPDPYRMEDRLIWAQK